MNIKDIYYDVTKIDYEQFKEKYKNKTNDELLEMLYESSVLIANDKNSSMVREYATLKECNYTQNTNKLDYDGYNSENIPVEVKPANFYTDNPKSKKLNGHGSFNDYTWERYDRDYEKNPEVLFSGFVDGKLIFILSVRYRDINGIKEKLEKRFPNRVRNVGEFLRTIQLSYKNYKDAESLQIKYSDKEKIKKYKKCINKKLYDKLLSE